mgnify:FL=1
MIHQQRICAASSLALIRSVSMFFFIQHILQYAACFLHNHVIPAWLLMDAHVDLNHVAQTEQDDTPLGVQSLHFESFPQG